MGVDHVHAGTVVGKLEGDPQLDEGLLRHAAGQLHPREPAERHLLRPGLGLDARRHAGRLGRHPRRPDAPVAALPRRGRDPPVRRRHDRPSDGDQGRRDGEPGRGRGDDPGPQRGQGLLPGGAGHPRAGGEGLPRAERRARRSGRTSRSTSSPPTSRTSSRPRPSGTREAEDDENHTGNLLVPARLHRRADRGADALRGRQRLGALDRVHRRPASAQRLLGDVGPAPFRPAGRRRRDGDARGARLPRGLPRGLHQGARLRRDATAGRRPR